MRRTSGSHDHLWTNHKGQECGAFWLVHLCQVCLYLWWVGGHLRPSSAVLSLQVGLEPSLQRRGEASTGTITGEHLGAELSSQSQLLLQMPSWFLIIVLLLHLFVSLSLPQDWKLVIHRRKSSLCEINTGEVNEWLKSVSKFMTDIRLQNLTLRRLN